jgi:hypothetical protein
MVHVYVRTDVRTMVRTRVVPCTNGTYVRTRVPLVPLAVLVLDLARERVRTYRTYVRTMVRTYIRTYVHMYYGTYHWLVPMVPWYFSGILLYLYCTNGMVLYQYGIE